MQYVTKEDLQIEMKDKVSIPEMDEMKETLNKLQTIQGGNMESLTEKINNMKEEYETKTKEMLDQIDDLKKQMEELEDDESYEDELDSSNRSEEYDNFDVDDVNKDQSDGSGNGTKDGEGEEEEPAKLPTIEELKAGLTQLHEAKNAT